jgi:hypothetical protein
VDIDLPIGWFYAVAALLPATLGTFGRFAWREEERRWLSRGGTRQVLRVERRKRIVACLAIIACAMVLGPRLVGALMARLSP